MDRPMKAYGLNVVEQALDDVLVGAGWVLAAFTIVAGVMDATFATGATAGGLLLGATALAGLLLALGGSGIRQNAAATDIGFALLAVATAGWIVAGITAGSAGALVAGLALAALLVLVVALRRRALRLRFRPRFLSLRQFTTMIAVADTMIEGDGREALHPIEVAINVDHMLDRVESPTTAQLRLVLVITEWLLPLFTVFRPFPFSVLGSNDRRRAVEKVIGAPRLFRPVARSLKILACSGYYSDQRGIRSTGFIHFEDRARHVGVDETPLVHPDPGRTP